MNFHIYIYIYIYTQCHISFNAMIRVWKFQDPLCTVYYMIFHTYYTSNNAILVRVWKCQTAWCIVYDMNIHISNEDSYLYMKPARGLQTVFFRHWLLWNHCRVNWDGLGGWKPAILKYRLSAADFRYIGLRYIGWKPTILKYRLSTAELRYIRLRYIGWKPAILKYMLSAAELRYIGLRCIGWKPAILKYRGINIEAK